MSMGASIVVCDKAVEQGHLVRDRAEIGPPGETWKILAQRISGWIDIEGQGVGAIETQVIDEKAGQKRLPALQARRGNDEEGRSVVLGRGCNTGRRMLA